MTNLRRLVLDLLKPHEPTSLVFAQEISELDGVEGVNALLLEVDSKVDNIKLTIEGDDIDFEKVKETVKELGGSVHSVDEVVCGNQMVEESETPQD